MSPANIESRLKAASPLIGSAVVIGDRRPYNVALIVLDPDAAPPARPEELEAAIGEAVETANARSRAPSRSSATRSSTASGRPEATS